MSQEDVDLALAFTAAYNAPDIDAAVGLCVADVDVSPDASIYPEASALVGRDEYRTLLEESRSAWTSCTHTPEDVLDVGDGRVLIRGDWGGEGVASGAVAYQSLSAIFTVRDGQIARVEYFFDHEEALEAVGLRE